MNSAFGVAFCTSTGSHSHKQGSSGALEYAAAHQKSCDLVREVRPVPTLCIQNCGTQLMIIPTYYACHVNFFTLKCKTHKQDSFLT